MLSIRTFFIKLILENHLHKIKYIMTYEQKNILWVVTAKVGRRPWSFGEAYYLHLQGPRVSQARNQQDVSGKIADLSLYLLSQPEDGASMFLQNISDLPYYTASRARNNNLHSHCCENLKFNLIHCVSFGIRYEYVAIRSLCYLYVSVRQHVQLNKRISDYSITLNCSYRSPSSDNVSSCGFSLIILHITLMPSLCSRIDKICITCLEKTKRMTLQKVSKLKPSISDYNECENLWIVYTNL
jgi:hypothetical protein